MQDQYIGIQCIKYGNYEQTEGWVYLDLLGSVHSRRVRVHNAVHRES